MTETANLNIKGQQSIVFVLRMCGILGVWGRRNGIRLNNLILLDFLIYFYFTSIIWGRGMIWKAKQKILTYYVRFNKLILLKQSCLRSAVVLIFSMYFISPQLIKPIHNFVYFDNLRFLHINLKIVYLFF